MPPVTIRQFAAAAFENRRAPSLEGGGQKLTKRAKQRAKKSQLLELAFSKCLILLENLVEPGGIEPPSASPPQSVLHA